LIQTENKPTSLHTTHMLGVRNVCMKRSRGHYCSSHVYCFRCNETVYTDHPGRHPSHSIRLSRMLLMPDDLLDLQELDRLDG